MKQYLESSEFIDCDHPDIILTAETLKTGLVVDVDIAKACFEYVRDSIEHTSDYQIDVITCKASDVLRQKTGYCYAKAHLLAALLRANNIPAGLCYQRLSISGSGGPYCLHGLNAVYLNRYGWYRLDPRGNKKGVNADFIPPIEQLAFPVVDALEADIQGVWPEPLRPVVSVLTRYNTYLEVDNHLPDIDVLSQGFVSD